MIIIGDNQSMIAKELFKLMALESQHAGLSWLTILKKKESYEQAFYNFEPSIYRNK